MIAPSNRNVPVAELLLVSLPRNSGHRIAVAVEVTDLNLGEGAGIQGRVEHQGVGLRGHDDVAVLVQFRVSVDPV